MTPQDDDQAPRDAAVRPPAAPSAADAGAGGADPAADGGGHELRITVARSGGIVGIGPTWAVTVSAEADVDSWLSLVESCPWDPPEIGAREAGEAAPIGGGVDRFVYTIRVFLPTEEERDARVPEQHLDGPWRDLVDRVKDAAPKNERRTPRPATPDVPPKNESRGPRPADPG